MIRYKDLLFTHHEQDYWILNDWEQKFFIVCSISCGDILLFHSYISMVAVNLQIFHFSLTEELRRKNREVERLTDQLMKKNSKITQLNQDLAITQNQVQLLQEQAGNDSRVSDVYRKSPSTLRSPSHGVSPIKSPTSTISSNRGGVSPIRSPTSTIRSPTSTVSDARRLSEMSNFDHTEKSTERLRHETGTSNGSHAPFIDDVNFTAVTMDTSVRSAGTQDSMSRSFSKNIPNGVTDFTCTSTILGSEDRMMEHRHDYYDATHTPTYLHDTNDVSFPSLHLDSSHGDKDNSRRVTFSETTRSESPVNNVSILTTRLNALEDLNRTLKDEIHLYEKMCTSMGTQISPRKSPTKSSGDIDKDLLLEHLQEIRALRTKLEKSLHDSDRLREALERDMNKDEASSGWY